MSSRMENVVASAIDGGNFLFGGRSSHPTEEGTESVSTAAHADDRHKQSGFLITLAKDGSNMEYVNLCSQNGSSSAKIYLFGATVTSWKVSGDEQLFVSSRAIMDGTKPIRGGIPLVFPQFGAHPLTKQSNMSQHGFARSSKWIYCENESKSCETYACAVFQLQSSEETKAVWGYDFKLQYVVTLSAETLQIELQCTNTDTASYDMQALLHTYLRVPDITTTTVMGLRGRRYIDQLSENKSLETETQEQVAITAEADRILMEVAAEEAEPTVTLLSNAEPRLFIDSKATLQTNGAQNKDIRTNVVFWNAWDAKCERLVDMDDEAYRSYVCIEPGIGISKAVHLQSGSTVCVQQTLRRAPASGMM